MQVCVDVSFRLIWVTSQGWLLSLSLINTVWLFVGDSTLFSLPAFRRFHPTQLSTEVSKASCWLSSEWISYILRGWEQVWGRMDDWLSKVKGAIPEQWGQLGRPPDQSQPGLLSKTASQIKLVGFHYFPTWWHVCFCCYRPGNQSYKFSEKMTIFLTQACTQNKCMKHIYVSKLAGEMTLLLGAATYPITTD